MRFCANIVKNSVDVTVVMHTEKEDDELLTLELSYSFPMDHFSNTFEAIRESCYRTCDYHSLSKDHITSLRQSSFYSITPALVFD